MSTLDTSVLKQFTQLYPQFIDKYEQIIPNSNQTISDKINAIINSLNQVGGLTNQVVKNWNTVMTWCLNDGLTSTVSTKIDAMKASGELDTILTTLFNVKLGDLTQLQTVAKDTLVNAINNNVTQLAKIVTLINGLKSDDTFDNAPLINQITTLAGSKNVKLPSGNYPVYTPIIVRSNMHLKGNGIAETYFIQKADQPVFKAEGVDSNNRTFYFSLEDFTVTPKTGNTTQVFNLNGGSYFKVKNVQCPLGDGTTQSNNDCITVDVTSNFNGYYSFEDVFVYGFNRGLKATGNQIRVIGGLYNSNKLYGIYITASADVTIDNPELSANLIGGIYIDSIGINIKTPWFEANGNRDSNQYSPNNIEIAPTSKYVHVNGARWDISTTGVYHGTKSDKGVHFGGGIGNAENSTYGLIPNGFFDKWDGVSADPPYGFTKRGVPTFSTIPDPNNTPQGVGGGIRVNLTADYQGLYYTPLRLLGNAKVNQYTGKEITMHFLARTDGIIRIGLSNSNDGVPSNFFTTSANGQWNKMSVKYTIVGNESNLGFALMRQSGGTYCDITGLTMQLGDHSWGNFEQAITSDGGEIWSQNFMIGGKRHGFGTVAPTTGTWNQGDIVWNTAPTASGNIGWVCVTNGTPGTWKTFGTISA